MLEGNRLYHVGLSISEAITLSFEAGRLFIGDSLKEIEDPP